MIQDSSLKSNDKKSGWLYKVDKKRGRLHQRIDGDSSE
jgi:hypothetical protein